MKSARLATLIAAALAFSSAANASPITLVHFDFEDSDRVADTVDPGLLAAPVMTDGSGFAAIAAGTGIGTFASSTGIFFDQTDYSNISSDAQTNMTNGLYFEFTLQADPGKTFSISSVGFESGRTGSGLSNVFIYSSADDYASSVASTGNMSSSGQWFQAGPADTSGNPALQDLTSITFRLVSGANPNTSGTNRNIFYDDVIIQGTVIPEPGSLALVGVAGVLMMLTRRGGHGRVN